MAIVAIMATTLMTTGCNSDDDDTWSKYETWRKTNDEYFRTCRDSIGPDGKPYYQVLYPNWNPAAEILIRYFNDRQETSGNLKPMLTSMCDVIYHGRLSSGTPFDSSYTMTQYGRGIARLVPQKTVQGFAIALMDMNVGDTCEIVIPYDLAYGAQTNGLILPYSALKFNIRLKDIPYYEVRE